VSPLPSPGRAARRFATVLRCGRAPAAHRRAWAASSRASVLERGCRWLPELLAPPPRLRTGPWTGFALTELASLVAPVGGDPGGKGGEDRRGPRPDRSAQRRTAAGEPIAREARRPRRQAPNGSHGRAAPPEPWAASPRPGRLREARRDRRAPTLEATAMGRGAGLPLLRRLAGGEEGAGGGEAREAVRRPPQERAPRRLPPPEVAPARRRRWLRGLAARAARELLAPAAAGVPAGGRRPSAARLAETSWRTPLGGPEAPARLLRAAAQPAGARAAGAPPLEAARRAARPGAPTSREPDGEGAPAAETSASRQAPRPPFDEPPRPAAPESSGVESAAAGPRARRPLPGLVEETGSVERREPAVPALRAPEPLRPLPPRGLEAGTAEDDLGRLAERMRRILAEEARRHGIDV